ncbi:MAG: ankyrin repeat domain-containing protein [Tepidisphaeraceae bacterium]
MMTRYRCAMPWVVLLLIVLAHPLARQSAAHETDQFTLPSGREFADFGPRLTRLAYDAIAKGVDSQNREIKSAVDKAGIKAEIKSLQAPEELVASVNRQFPVAMFLIDRLDRASISDQAKQRHPGRIVGYKPDVGVRKNIDIAINPFRAWGCATINAYGVYFGTDKIGHFTDMGNHYYRVYGKARADGKSDDDAAHEATKFGTHGLLYSERGMLGLKTAGAYSNADLVANYMGLCFYRNLTEPIKLKGQLRPPMVVREGEYWKLAPHVQADSDFFSWFFPEHLNEALNPSLYREGYRERMRDSIRDVRRGVMARYTDPNGNVRLRDWFVAKTAELSTYWDFDYGHEGKPDQLITIADTCFAPAPDLNHARARNADGLTSLHWVAQNGDIEAIKRLLDAGADVNARVTPGLRAPAVGGDSPLHLAAGAGKLEAVQLLLARGADAAAHNDLGVTPLHRAIVNPQIAEAISNAADVNVADATGRTPLHWASNDSQASAALKILLDHGARPMPKDRDGRTPLHLAARSGHADAIAALVSGGADVNATDRFGVTPLHLAAVEAAPRVTDLLLQAGAQPNMKDDFGSTPLLAATRADREQVVKILLTHRADPAIANAYGDTSIRLADRVGLDHLKQLFQASSNTSGGAVTAGDGISPGAQ